MSGRKDYRRLWLGAMATGDRTLGIGIKVDALTKNVVSLKLCRALGRRASL